MSPAHSPVAGVSLRSRTMVTARTVEVASPSSVSPGSGSAVQLVEESAILTTRDAEELAKIRGRTVEAFEALVPRGSHVAIVDAPNQRNVGDSLIWLGELAYLRTLGHRLRYVADLATYDASALRRSLPTGGIVLIHGGGNFGDLWLGHQKFRERVADELQDFRVVQLPQSIYFEDAERAKLANRTIRRHTDFHVLVRDSLSVDRMKDLLPDVSYSYCPDMALGWDVPNRRTKPRKTADVLVLARADKEASSGLAQAAASWSTVGRVAVTDWEPRGARSVAWTACRALSRVYKMYGKVRRKLPFLPAGFVDRSFGHVITALARVNFSGAEHLYRRTSYVVVDRLHAHVLAVLMGVPHTALDNNYGKVSSIFDDYSGVFSTATYAQSPASALEIVEKRLVP